MIKIEKAQTYGWEEAVRGMRNPLNSWHMSDSHLAEVICGDDEELPEVPQYEYRVGIKDYDLMKRLGNAGNDHAKYLRMITVYMDITAPLYWWKEFDTYKVGTVANSCSTMHKIHAKEFELDDFSFEHLIENDDFYKETDITEPDTEDYMHYAPKDILECWVIPSLNKCRDRFIETKDKKYWWQMIQLLPSSYNQKRTVMLNYQVLKAMYHARKNHKLDEWHDFCKMIEELPYSELITGEK